MSNWNSFPHDNTAFMFEGSDLLESWPDLHCGDRAEFPDADWVQQCLEQAPDAAPPSYDGDAAALANIIQDAWRCFHAGDFQPVASVVSRSLQMLQYEYTRAALRQTHLARCWMKLPVT